MARRERRRRLYLRAIEQTKAKLAGLEPAKYRGEVDYRRVRTFYGHRLAFLQKLLKGEDDGTEP